MNDVDKLFCSHKRTQRMEEIVYDNGKIQKSSVEICLDCDATIDGSASVGPI